MTKLANIVSVTATVALVGYVLTQAVPSGGGNSIASSVGLTLEQPPEEEKMHGFTSHLTRLYSHTPYTLLSAEFRNEKVYEKNDRGGLEYTADISAQLHFPQGSGAECAGPTASQPYRCQFADKFPMATSPIAPGSTITLIGTHKFERETDRHPWEGGVQCCITRAN